MIAKKIRIQNYKSIIDSGDCYLEESLTIFAGKNGCGKTTILEALEDFNLNRDIDKKAISKVTPSKPEITVTFSISPEELNKYYRRYGMPKTETVSQEIEIKKLFVNNSHQVVGTNASEILQTAFWGLKLQEFNKNLGDAHAKLLEAHNSLLKDRLTVFAHTTNLVSLKIFLQNYRTAVDQYYESVADPIIKIQKNTILPHLNFINTIITQIENNSTSNLKSREYFVNLIPNFILFKSFNDSLPTQVALDSTINQNLIVQDIQKIIPCNFVNFSRLSENEQKKQRDNTNKIFNENYSNYWKQDNSKFDIEWKEAKLSFWIKNDDEYFEWGEESQGKQWHILFFIKVMAQSKNGKQNVIMIDEPGASLHATAQKDIYKMLLESSEKSQIIFTTHSPYLIFEKELHRIRLVLKKTVAKGTIIENKIHKGADKETLTPIMTAIGMSINDGIHSVDKHYNVIVEGQSDVYYLRAFSKILQNEKYNFIFGGSSSKLGIVGTILNGWGCKAIYLFDNDKVKVREDPSLLLQKEWHIDSNFILKVKDIVGTIEDVFSQNYFKEKILEDSDAVIESTNGDYAKAKKIDKVLKAKLFLNKVEKSPIDFELDKETLNNVKSLFQKFENAFTFFDK